MPENRNRGKHHPPDLKIRAKSGQRKFKVEHGFFLHHGGKGVLDQDLVHYDTGSGLLELYSLLIFLRQL